MNIAITGASGYIGRLLIEQFKNQGHEVTAISRKKIPEIKTLAWDSSLLSEVIRECDIIIHLAGANISSLWTQKKLEEIWNSRTQTGQFLRDVICKNQIKGKRLIQCSGVAIYGDRDDEFLNESSETRENNFLSKLAHAWENSTRDIETLDWNRQIVRIGIVMGTGGFLSKIKWPFLFFIGGHLGKGENYLSWISEKDLVRAFDFIVTENPNESLFNLVSPQPLRSKIIFQIIAQSLKRPSYLHLPDWILKFLPNNMANELFLCSQRVYPERLLQHHFEFTHTQFEKFLIK